MCLYTCAQTHVRAHTIVGVDLCAGVHTYIQAYNFKSSFTLLTLNTYFFFASSFTNSAGE